MKLLDGVTADVDGATFDVPSGGSKFRHPLFSFFVYSTAFGGGTVLIQLSPDGTNWFTARALGSDAQMAFTEADYMVGAIRAPYVRATLSGATAPAALTVDMF